MRGILGVGLVLLLGLGSLAWAQDGTKPAVPTANRPAAAAVPTPASAAAVKYFETQIRPLLAQNCFSCHGEHLQRAGLRLDREAGLRKGSESGPVVVPGNPDKSPLIQAVRYAGETRMPPQGKLSARAIQTLSAWVKAGAVWGVPDPAPGTAPASDAQAAIRTDWWSFQPVKPQHVPAVKNKALAGWARNPIDAFVLAKLEARGLRPSAPAPPRELIRRAYFDLIGLPPTPEEVDRFTADPSPAAYERMLDHLLSLPQFGERWGRHWLDIVRFGQTNGYERDEEKPDAWRYRDYVIKSFNEDKPYDQFIREQLAGDEQEQPTDDSITATAFYRLGVWDDEPDDGRQAEFDNLDDMLSTTGQAFLGLTIGCARCHDHKFDPIPQEDYYGLLAFLRNIHRYANPSKEVPLKPILVKLRSGGETLAVSEYGSSAPATRVLLRGLASTPGVEVQPHFLRALCPTKEAATPTIPVPAPGSQTCGRRRILADWIASPANPLTARVMVNRLWQHLFGRGIVATPNDFGHTGLAPTHPELLDWLATEFTSPTAYCAPLTAHGSLPTSSTAHGPRLTAHSEWSIKRMLKLIMLSSTYRQSSRASDARAAKVDPANGLFWHQNLRRLEAEAIRDSILSTSGKLNLEMGGRGIFPALSAEVLATQSRPGNGWDKSPEEQRCRRSVYVYVKRTLGVPFLDIFDATVPDSPVGARATTTIAPQALTLLNSSFMVEQAAAFADRLVKEAGTDPAREIQRAFRLALDRAPTARETAVLGAFLQRQYQRERAQGPDAGRSPSALGAGGQAADPAYRRALQAFCKLVFNLNEFVYVD